MKFLKRFTKDAASTTKSVTYTAFGSKVAQDVSILSDSAFNEILISSPRAVSRGSAAYGFLPSNFRSITSGGSISFENGLIKLSSGSNIFDYATIQSFRPINYRDGTSAIVRFSCYFADAVPLTWQGAGAVTLTDEYTFGYNGTSFGVWHRYGGKAEVRLLTVTGAAGGSENATITLNGVAYTVPLTAGTTAKNANEIATYLNANATDWNAEQNDSGVIISSRSDGPKSLTFSFSSGTATATFSTTKTGVIKTSVHIPQSEFSEGVWSDFDPSKGNSYQIVWQNGFSAVYFYITHPESGKMTLVHTLQWSNSNTIPSVSNSSMRLGAYAYSIGATQNIDLYVSYLAGFIDGNEGEVRNPRAFANTKSISTTATNILTVRNKRIYNGFYNQVELRPKRLTLANDGTKSAVFELRTGATLTGNTNYTNTGNNLVSEVDVSGGAVSGGTLIDTFTVAKGQSIGVDLESLKISVPPTLAITISGNMVSGSAADLTATLTWIEDI